MDEAARRECSRVDLANRLRMEEISWRQKACLWIKEEDKNTRYFQYLASHRRRYNYMDELFVDNRDLRGDITMKRDPMVFFPICIENNLGED